MVADRAYRRRQVRGRCAQPRHLVSPNALHHLFLAQWRSAYPKPRLYASSGLRKKRKDLVFDADLGRSGSFPRRSPPRAPSCGRPAGAAQRLALTRACKGGTCIQCANGAFLRVFNLPRGRSWRRDRHERSQTKNTRLPRASRHGRGRALFCRSWGLRNAGMLLSVAALLIQAWLPVLRCRLR